MWRKPKGERERAAAVVDVLRIFRVDEARDVEEMEGRERESGWLMC
jgi:hypothetical protein